MAQSRPVASTLLWLSVLFVLGALVTYVAFAVFIPSPERGMTFYIALSAVCAAEFVFFAHLAHSRLAQAGVRTARTATRIQVHALIVVWFLLTVIAAAVAVSPERADTAAANKVLVVQLILTFLFFASAYFLYTRDIEIEGVDIRLSDERRRIRLSVPDIEGVMRVVDSLARRHADHAVLTDRVCKKLDSVRTGLESVLVSERVLDGRMEGAEDWNVQIEQHITQLVSLASEASTWPAGDVPGKLEDITEKAETILSTLSRRERMMTS